MLPRQNRLPVRPEKNRFSKLAQPYSSPLFTLLVINNSSKKPSRFGAIISKKISNKAVIRNKLRRRLAGIILPLLPQIRPGFDVLILPRKTLASATFTQTKQQLTTLLKKANILAERK